MSVVLVIGLTVVGVITGNTASRQGSIEHVVRVERVRVNSALCSGESQFTTACRRHATRVIEACVATHRCALLLRAIREGKVSLPPLPRREAPAPAAARQPVSGGPEPATAPAQTPSSTHGTVHHGGGKEPASPPPSGGSQPPSREPSSPPPAAEAPPPASSTAEPPKAEPEPAGEAKGLTECVSAVDVPCAGKAVGAVVESTVEAAKDAIGR